MAENKLSFLVIMQKKTAKSHDRFFVVIQIRRDEFTNPAVFHGIGYWAEEKPVLTDGNSKMIDMEKVIEVWIPWEKIDHVESLMYRSKS